MVPNGWNLCVIHVLNHFQQLFSHIMMVSGFYRELNANFYSATLYHTLGTVPTLAQKSECQVGNNLHRFSQLDMTPKSNLAPPISDSTDCAAEGQSNLLIVRACDSEISYK